MQEMLQFPLSKGKLSEASAAISFLGSICHLVEQPGLAEIRILWHIPTGTWSSVLLRGCKKQRAALQLPASVQFMSEKRSATKPMLLQEEEILNSVFLAYETKQLQTPKCQKLSQQFITFMKTS